MKLKKEKQDKHYNKIYFTIIFFLIISFSLNNGIFRKFYNILISNYDHRINKIYGNCGEESIGFIKMLKEKYKFKTNPKIINFKHNPPSLWAIYDNKIKNNNGSNIIFLNYSKTFKLKFNRSRNTYKSINRFVEPNLPNNKIGIIHLAGGIWVNNKDMRKDNKIKINIKTTDDKIVSKSLRFCN